MDGEKGGFPFPFHWMWKNHYAFIIALEWMGSVHDKPT